MNKELVDKYIAAKELSAPLSKQAEETREAILVGVKVNASCEGSLGTVKHTQRQLRAFNKAKAEKILVQGGIIEPIISMKSKVEVKKIPQKVLDSLDKYFDFEKVFIYDEATAKQLHASGELSEAQFASLFDTKDSDVVTYTTKQGFTVEDAIPYIPALKK